MISTKRLATLLGLMALGVLVGYFATPGNEKRPPLPAEAVPPAPPNKELTGTHRFLLGEGNVQADRETPAIAVDGKGRVLLAYAEQTAPLERTLFVVRSADGVTFEKPTPFRKVPIYKYAAGTSRKKTDSPPAESDKPAMTFSTHVLPRLATHGDEITLGWVEAVNGGPKVVYYTATSTDGGKTFGEPQAAHSPEVAKPGFTALSTSASGEVEASWLDGGKPVVAVKQPGSAGFEAETVAYPGPPGGGGICPCCDTAVIHPEKGPLLVAFRNNDGDRRDIWIAAASDKGFKAAQPIGKHQWTFKGCPHDGPSLADVGGRLQVVFMDAHTGVNRVYFAESDLGSLAFEPRELAADSKGSQGHPRIVRNGNGLIAIWDESLEPAVAAKPGEDHSKGHHAAATSGSGRAVRVAASIDGKSFGPSIAVNATENAFQLNPAAVVLPSGDVLVAWNELDANGKTIVTQLVSKSQLRK